MCNVRDRKCPYETCKYEPHDKGKLVDHLNAIHIRFPAFRCDICLKGFYSKLSLIMHRGKTKGFSLTFFFFKKK